MLGVLVATHIVPGIAYKDNATLAAVVIVLALLNTLLRPALRTFLIFISLPLVLLTFGLAALLVLWVANSLLIYLTAALVPTFTVASFWDAMLGALVISGVSWLLSLLLGDSPHSRNNKPPPPPSGTHRLPTNKDDDDVIDI